MSKISELSDGGSLVSTDFLIAVRSGGNVKVKMDTINVDQVDLGDNASKLTESSKFLSGKILLSEGKKYSCYEAKKAKKELTGDAELVYDSEDFWKELDHYRLINEL